MSVVYSPTFTNYLPLVGDKPPVVAFKYEYAGNIEIPFRLEEYITAEQIADFRARVSILPRSTFDTLLASICSNIATNAAFEGTLDVKEAIKTNLLEIFNQEGAKLIALNGMTNWDFEQLKMQAFYKTEAEKNFEAETSFDELTIEALDKENELNMRFELERRYVSLPPLNDTALQLQRTIAFKLLLDKGAIASAKMVLDFYETLSDDMKQVINT